jgi:hypothetical protein
MLTPNKTLALCHMELLNKQFEEDDRKEEDKKKESTNKLKGQMKKAA